MRESKFKQKEIVDVTKAKNSNKIVVFLIMLTLFTIVSASMYFVTATSPDMYNPEFVYAPIIQEERVFGMDEILTGPDSTQGNITLPVYFENHRVPVHLPDWLLSPYHMGFNERDAINWSRNTSLADHMFTLSSREHGFTSNPDDFWNYDEETGDYLINLYFQYVLREDVEYYLATYLHRLLNPVFGGWHRVQPNMLSENFSDETFYIFEDMFTPWLWETIETFEDLPLKMDIRNYMSSDVVSEENNQAFLIGFFGEANQNDIRIEVEAGSQGLLIWNFFVPVVYTAIVDSELSLIKVEGTLFLQLSPNFGEGNRMLISDFSLILEE